MIEFPPLPSWDALHPLIVHFPIALLLFAPLFVVVGALLRTPRGRSFQAAALSLMVAGTIATFVAAATGEAAGKLADRTELSSAVLEHHESLAESTRAVFTGLTLAFAAILFGPRLFKIELAPTASAALTVAFLVFYSAGAVLLANTAHNGGRLVHELGITAMVPAGGMPPGSNAPGSADSDD